MVGFVVLTQAYRDNNNSYCDICTHKDLNPNAQLESSIWFKWILNSLCDKLRIRDRQESEPRMIREPL